MGIYHNIDGNVKYSNTASKDDVIWEYEVPVGAELHFPTVQPIQMKLYDSTGAEIDENSLVWFAVKVPYQKAPIPITKPIPYLEFKIRSKTDQTDINKQVKMEALDEYIDKPEFIIKKKRKLLLYINSPDVVDWSQGSFFILSESNLRASD